MSKRVLVCEDDFAIRLLFGEILSRHKLTVDSVASGADAVERLRRETYELVILDLLTPGLTGYDVIEVLRRERPEMLRRVVVVTAQQRAIRAPLPVAEVVAKPFELEQFDGIIDRVLFDSSRPHGTRETQSVERLSP